MLFGNNGKNARLIGTAVLIVTFIVGALAGAAVFRVVAAEGPRPEHARVGGPMRGSSRRLLLDDQFAKDIGLTADQRAQIKNILDRRDAEAKKMWSQFEPQLKSFGKQVHDEIQHVLTPEQQKKLDAALEQRRKTFRQHHNCVADSTKRI